MIAYPSATVALFDPTMGELPRRTLDVKKLEKFVTELANAGATSLLIGSSTGQGHLRNPSELESMFREAAAVKPAGLTLMGLLRPEDGIDTNRRLLLLLKELEYSVAYLRPGTDQSESDDNAIVANLSPLVIFAYDCGMPVGLYSISDVSGAPLTANAAAKLVSGPGGNGVVAVKVTERDYQASTQRFLDHPELKHLKIVQGWDPHLATAMKHGRSADGASQRCGVTSGAMSFAIFQYQHIFTACDHHHWAEVSAAQDALTRMFASMQDDPTKFADLQRAKFIMGLGHPIKSEVSPEQTKRVIDALQQVPRASDRKRLAASINLMKDGPFHEVLASIENSSESFRT